MAKQGEEKEDFGRNYSDMAESKMGESKESGGGDSKGDISRYEDLELLNIIAKEADIKLFHGVINQEVSPYRSQFDFSYFS